MKKFNTLTAIISSFLVWYFIGWFISGESNPIIWPWWGKIVYLWFGFQTAEQISK